MKKKTDPVGEKEKPADGKGVEPSASKGETLAAKRRMQIFDAASVVFGRQGYHKATVKEIAIEAGLGKGTLYEYIRSKQDLLFIVVEEGHRRILESVVKQINDASLSPEEKLRRAVQIQVGFIDHYSDAARALMPEVEGLTEYDRDRMEKVKENYLQVFRRILDEGVAAGVFRDFDTLAASEVICNACILWGKSDTLRETLKSARKFETMLNELFINGLKK